MDRELLLQEAVFHAPGHFLEDALILRQFVKEPHQILLHVPVLPATFG